MDNQPKDEPFAFGDKVTYCFLGYTPAFEYRKHLIVIGKGWTPYTNNMLRCIDGEGEVSAFHPRMLKRGWL